jgi:hypothetical protein
MTTPLEDVKPRLIDKVIGPSPTERAKDAYIERIESAFGQIALKHENWIIDAAGGVVTVDEALQNIDLMLDAQGWTNIWEADDNRGLTLRQTKEASRQLRELVVGNPLIGNGKRIRHVQTWGGGMEFSGRLRTSGKITGLPAATQRIIEEPWWQRYVFGNKAHGEMESAAFTDGVWLLLGRDGDKRVQSVSIQEIEGLLHNPNNHSEIWAYRRVWNPNPETADSENTAENRVRWYYTDAVPPAQRRRTIQVRGMAQPELAEPGMTMIDAHFNRQTGWALGVPDALCVVAWARLYKEFLVNGYVMSRSLARLAYKITAQNAQGAQNSATTIATPGQSGSTYIEGSGNTLAPLATAGKGYDFGSGGALGAAIAAGLGVSWLALSGNPAQGTGGAAASTLDPIAKATAAVRRGDWDDEFVRIFRFIGMDRALVTTWHDLPEDTIARIMQAWRLAEQMEIFSGEVLHREVSSVLQIANSGGLPAGWKQPSERGAQTSSTFGQTGQSPANGRGTDDGSGQSPDDHDYDEGN